MLENNELLLHIYKDAAMGEYTIENLIKDLEKKDNKIKKELTFLKENYSKWKTDTKERLLECQFEIKEEKIVNKVMAKTAIKKEVKEDNSDSSIADMLIKGISMGSIDMKKKVNNYIKICDKEIISYAKQFLKFQEKEIDKLKKYL